MRKTADFSKNCAAIFAQYAVCAVSTKGMIDILSFCTKRAYSEIGNSPVEQ